VGTASREREDDGTDRDRAIGSAGTAGRTGDRIPSSGVARDSRNLSYDAREQGP